MKNSLLVVYSTNILVRLLTGNMKNCLTPKNPKMCDPILVTLPKMRPYYRQSSPENATPSTGTSPLASYREVPPPRPIEWEPQLNWKYGYNHERLRSWTEGYLDVRLATSRPHEFKSDEGLFWKSAPDPGRLGWNGRPYHSEGFTVEPIVSLFKKKKDNNDNKTNKLKTMAWSKIKWNPAGTQSPTPLILPSVACGERRF